MNTNLEPLLIAIKDKIATDAAPGEKEDPDTLTVKKLVGDKRFAMPNLVLQKTPDDETKGDYPRIVYLFVPGPGFQDKKTGTLVVWAYDKSYNTCVGLINRIQNLFQPPEQPPGTGNPVLNPANVLVPVIKCVQSDIFESTTLKAFAGQANFELSYTFI